VVAGLHTIVTERGDAPALVDEFGVTTWRQLDERANRLIHTLRAAGLEQGDTIAIMCGNRRELFEILVASMHGAWVFVPVNWHWVADELAYVLKDAGAKVLFADARFADVAAEAVRLSGVPTLNVIVEQAPAGGQSEEVVTTSAASETMVQDFTEYEALLAGQPADEPEGQAFGGPMFYTSGTTGKPKGVRSSVTQPGLPIEMLSIGAQMFVDLLKLPTGPECATLLCGPAYHSAQWAWSFMPLVAGHTIVMRHKFVPEVVLDLIDAHRVTNVHLVPTQMTRLLRVPDERRAAFDGSSLRIVYHGAAPCPPDVKRQMIEWWGPIFTEYYGGTEGAILSTIDSEEWLAHPTSVGKLWPSVEVKVLHDDGTACEVGESGTIWVRNLLGVDFEYHNDPGKTADAHREPGVFTLGDIGFLDDEGYLHLSDRKIDMIISGGVNIYPAETEGVLSAHPAVRDVAVFGIPDEEFGESVHAVVELEDGADPSDALVAELLEHCRSRLAGYKCPRQIDFADELPRHPTGKLYKRLLRDPYWEGTGRRI
jgi:long-chain acyl-CoA synthetase